MPIFTKIEQLSSGTKLGLTGGKKSKFSNSNSIVEISII